MSDLESIILYLLVAITSTCFFALNKNKNRVIRRLGIVMSILIPSIMAGIRFNVGTDYANYYWTFEHLKDVDYSSLITGNNILNMDGGFLIISKLLNICFSSKALFGIWSVIILIIAISAIYSYRNKYDATIIYYLFMLLYYFSSFNILRQVVAASAVFWAIRYIFANKPVRFTLTIVLASTIHFSALLALPMWFFWDHKNEKAIKASKRWIILLVVLLSVIFIKEVLQYLATSGVAPIIKYSQYLSGNDHTNMSFIIKIILASLFILNEKKFGGVDKKIEFFIFIFTIGALLDFTGYFSSFIKRSAIYYSMSEIVLFSRLPILFTERSKKIVRCSIIIISSIYFVLSAYILGQGGLIPFTYT